nr:MAG TPA: hypothetical protein [Caudoviricetes sp.]
MPLSTKAVAFQISALMRFFERPGGFVEIIIPQIVQKEKQQTRKPAASMRFVRNRTQLRLLYHTSSILSIIFSLLPIDVRQYGTRAAISTWHSWSTYRNRAIFRSYLPSGARFITAFICSALSPCNAGGKTTRAAATGSTEPERFGELSGVANHIANHGETVTFCHHFRNVTKLLLCGVHLGDATGMLVCSACHDITPYCEQ